MIFGRKPNRAAILEKIKSSSLILDVRTSDEYAEGAYPGARNVPVQELADRLAELGPKAAPVIVYCASGARSARAARILKGAGFADVTDCGGLDGMPR
jgi:phage shock protein E